MKNILGIVFLIGLSAFLIYWFFIRKSKQSPCLPCQENKKKADEAVIELKGETTAHANYDADYKKVRNNNYYLTYADENGKTELEEITEEQYQQFMQDYPEGKAKGNVIEKCKNKTIKKVVVSPVTF